MHHAMSVDLACGPRTYPPFPAVTSNVYRTHCRARYEFRVTLFLKHPPADELDRAQLTSVGGRTCNKCKPKCVSSATARAATRVGEARAQLASYNNNVSH